MTGWLGDGEAWAQAVNPDLPPGVIELQDTEGRWWRYPLAEFHSEPEG